MHRVGGGLLEELLGVDLGHRGQRLDCGRGHQAEFISYRTKAVDSVLGEVAVRRAYYHCEECEHGFCPRDRELGIEGSSLSPGMLRMVCRTGSEEPFVEARRDLKELAGVELTAKRIERATEATGESVRLGAEQEADGIVSGQILPAVRAEPVAKLYITLVGTGVPTVPKENQGRPGKGPDGRAHTREVKLGCIFTQTKLDDQGNPVRDPDSSTYAFSLDRGLPTAFALVGRGQVHRDRIGPSPPVLHPASLWPRVNQKRCRHASSIGYVPSRASVFRWPAFACG